MKIEEENIDVGNSVLFVKPHSLFSRYGVVLSVSVSGRRVRVARWMCENAAVEIVSVPATTIIKTTHPIFVSKTTSIKMFMDKMHNA